MSPETITRTDGEEEIKNPREQIQESLSNIEKMNIRRLWNRIGDGIVVLGESIDKLDDTNKFDNRYLTHDVLPKIKSLIGRYQSEDSLETKFKNKQRDLSSYIEYKRYLDAFGEGMERFLEEVQGQAMTDGITKEELKNKYDSFVRGSLSELHDSVDAVAPEA